MSTGSVVAPVAVVVRVDVVAATKDPGGCRRPFVEIAHHVKRSVWRLAPRIRAGGVE